MPRLKPPPREIDTSKPMEVNLEDENEVLLTPEEGDDEAQREAKAQQAREYRQRKKEEDEARAQEHDGLKRQLDEMRAAMEEQKRITQESQRAQQEAMQRAQEREREARGYMSRAEEVEYQSVLTAMGSAESEAEGAKRELEMALTNQDHKAAVDAQSRLSRAEAKLIQLEGTKVSLEDRKNAMIARAEREKNNPPPPQRQLSVTEQIETNPALSYQQKEWLKAHQDAWTDPRKNMRLQGAHVEAEDQGLSPGSKPYFEYLEERLGYKKPDSKPEDDEDDPPVLTQRKTRMAAPVSRDNGNAGRPVNRNKVTLTPAQLEAAQISGLTPEAYARQLLKYQDAKEQGYYDN